MSQISVTAAEGRLVPLPGGKMVKPGDVIEVDENDMLIYRLMEHGDLVPAPTNAATVTAPSKVAAPAAASMQGA